MKVHTIKPNYQAIAASMGDDFNVTTLVVNPASQADEGPIRALVAAHLRGGQLNMFINMGSVGQDRDQHPSPARRSELWTEHWKGLTGSLSTRGAVSILLMHLKFTFPHPTNIQQTPFPPIPNPFSSNLAERLLKSTFLLNITTPCKKSIVSLPVMASSSFSWLLSQHGLRIELFLCPKEAREEHFLE